MAAALPNSIELFDYADTRLHTTLTCETPSADSYEATNLLSKIHHPPTISLLPSPPRSFMAESFVKPPIDLVFQLPYTVSLAAIAIDPRIRQSSAKSINVYILRGTLDAWHKWILVGRMTWESEEYQPRGLCNKELNPQVVGQVASRLQCGSLCAAGSVVWQPIDPPPDTLHSVNIVKLRISAMHQAHALGLGRIEIWAQPSQRLPAHQRTQAWASIRQTIQPPPIPADLTSAADSSTTDNCPQEFIDTITLSIMQDPVILPSNIRCDRSTIIRHLSTRKTDPFTGLPLELDQVKPDLLLQQRIREWTNNK
ncbi:RING finger protein 37 [Coemansia aciculifera]|nr:RING finger protein 37 [Coemansia aciculifera]